MLVGRLSASQQTARSKPQCAAKSAIPATPPAPVKRIYRNRWQGACALELDPSVMVLRNCEQTSSTTDEAVLAAVGAANLQLYIVVDLTRTKYHQFPYSSACLWLTVCKKASPDTGLAVSHISNVSPSNHPKSMESCPV